jgi:hypothetical protein
MSVVEWYVNMRVGYIATFINQFNDYEDADKPCIAHWIADTLDSCKTNIQQYRRIHTAFAKSTVDPAIEGFIHNAQLYCGTAARKMRIGDISGAQWCMAEMRSMIKPTSFIIA